MTSITRIGTRFYQLRGFLQYYISKDGKLWSIYGERPLQGNKSGKYLTVALYQNKQACQKRIHRLVLETFVGPCSKGMECCHNNGNPTDNRLENLRWGTRSSNVPDGVIFDD